MLQLTRTFREKSKRKTCKIGITPANITPNNATVPQTVWDVSVGGSSSQGKEKKSPPDHGPMTVPHKPGSQQSTSALPWLSRVLIHLFLLLSPLQQGRSALVHLQRRRWHGMAHLELACDPRK